MGPGPGLIIMLLLPQPVLAPGRVYNDHNALGQACPKIGLNVVDHDVFGNDFVGNDVCANDVCAPDIVSVGKTSCPI